MRALMQVTTWEFMRYFKWKQELVGLLVGLLIGALFTGGSALVTWTKSRQRPVVLVLDPQGLAPRSTSSLVFEPVTERAQAERQVAEGKRAGLLLLSDRTVTFLARRSRRCPRLRDPRPACIPTSCW